MKTWTAKKGDVKPKWWVMDAQGQTLGRLCTLVTHVLRGKNKPQFTPHVDTGDFIIVINSQKVKLTGDKLFQNKYYRRSRFFGSLKERTAQDQLAQKPEMVLKKAVKGMLPKNRLSRQLLKKLKVYEGPDHPHKAQKPEALKIS